MSIRRHTALRALFSLGMNAALVAAILLALLGAVLASFWLCIRIIRGLGLAGGSEWMVLGPGAGILLAAWFLGGRRLIGRALAAACAIELRPCRARQVQED